MPYALADSSATLTTLLRRGLATAMVVGVQAASAFTTVVSQPLDIHLSYAINSAFAISNVITFNDYDTPGVGSWWPASVPAGVGTIVDPFTKSSANAPLTGLMLGLTGALPGDPVGSGATHVVMMVNFAAGGAMQNTAFASLFPNTSETTLASQIQYVTGVTRDPDGTGNSATWDLAASGLHSFVSGDALHLSGSPSQSIWFGLGAVVPGATTTTGFSVLAFSNGQTLGNGVASLTTSLTPSVPEPQAWAMLMLGLGVCGLAARRRTH